MNEKRYLIEVLLRARETVSQIAQKAVKAIDGLTEAQKKHDAGSAASAASARQRVTALEQLIEAHTREKKALEESSASLRKNADALKVRALEARKSLEELQKSSRLEKALANKKEKRDIEEFTRIRREAAELDAFAVNRDAATKRQISQLRKEATAFESLAREEAAINKRRAAEFDLQIAQSHQESREATRAATQAASAAKVKETSLAKVDREIDTHVKQLTKLREQSNLVSAPAGRFSRAMDRMGFSTERARTGMRGLNAEFQGFQIALAIKYAQSLISALIALAAQFVAVAAAAGQAAIGIGAALAAGAAQAVPVIGLLVASFARLTTILKAVKLRNQEQLTATHDQARAAKAQQTAADQITSAQQRVADAHRAVGRAVKDLAQTRSDAAIEEIKAQRDVTQARQDAIRTVQDLMAAEEDAVQALERSREQRQSAIESGDVSGAIQADIDVTRARVDLRRARQDAAPVRVRGVEGVQAVQQAEQQLAATRRSGARQIQQAEQRLGDARRDELRATQDLTRTRQQAKDNLAQETAAVDKLTDSLKQLSPAERQLYRRLLALQETYKQFARPITDIITRAFTDVVDRVNKLIQDPRIIRGFRNIATAIATSIRTVASEAGGGRSVSAFQILSAEAARNIPIVTRILLNFFRAVRNLVLDAVPAFRLLLTYVEDYSDRALDASRNSKGITQFFIDGVKYAKAFFDLGLAVIRLLLTIAGRGGAAAEGIRTIHDLTGVIDDLTAKAKENAGSIRRFFAQTHDAFFAVLSVVGTLATTLLNTFSLRSVTTFADFLNRVIIPAIGNVLEIMGFLVNAFHQVFSLPGVAVVAQFAATILLLAKGLTVIRSAIGSIMGILPNFLRAMGLMVTAEEAAAGAGVVLGLSWGGIIVLALLAITAAVVLLDKKLHFLAPTWKWIKNAAVDAWDTVKGAAQSVISWFSDVWTQGLLYWIRWPFEQIAKHSGDIFGWIKNAVHNVIHFFQDRFGHGGFWGTIGTVLISPFIFFRDTFKAIFDAAKGIIELFLDLIAGRFDQAGDLIKDFWNGLLDTILGAVTSMLGVLSTLLSALGKVPKIGKPFAEAADSIDNARDNLDSYREGLRKVDEKTSKSGDEQKDFSGTVKSTTKESSDAFHDLAKKHGKDMDEIKKSDDEVKQEQQRYRDHVKETVKVANLQWDRLRVRHDDNFNTIKRRTETTGRFIRQQLPEDTAAARKATAENFQRAADAVQKQMDRAGKETKEGARLIRVYMIRGLKAFGLTQAQAEAKVDTGTIQTRRGPRADAARGGRMGYDGRIHRYGGGWIGAPGMVGMDTVPAMLAPGEAVLNRHQQGVVESLLGGGFLDRLFSQVQTPHYMARGGIVNVPGFPGERAASSVIPMIEFIAKRFALTLTDAFGPGHKSPGHTIYGTAADFAGPDRRMDAAVRYLVRRGYLVGYDGRFGSQDWPGHGPASGQGGSNAHLHVELGTRGAARLPTATLRIPRVTTNLRGGTGALVQRALDLLRGGAREAARARLGSLSTSPVSGGGRADMSVLSGFRRAIRTARATPAERLALWEAGIVESGLRNLAYGDRDSVGALQQRPSQGWHGLRNPYRAALEFLSHARALRPWRGSSGQLAQAVQHSQYPGRYDAVRGQAMRYMQRGGFVGTSSGPTAMGLGRGRSNVLSARDLVGRGLEPVMKRIADLFDATTKRLETVERGPLRRSHNVLLRIQRAFVRLTGDGGLLDRIRNQIDSIATRTALTLQRRQFRVGRGGPRRVALTDAQLAQGELKGLQETRGALTDERGALQAGIQDANAALREATRRHNSKAKAAARAALANLRKRLDDNSAALAQNAQDQVEAQERYQQALLDQVNAAAEKQNGVIDRYSRLAKAAGRSMDPNVVLGTQIRNMQTQVSGLQDVLERARRSGNVALADQIQNSIDELNVQIAEATAQQFQNSIDAVNNAAQKKTTRLDRATRLTQLGGRTDFAALGGILGQRGDVLRNQRAGLLSLLGQAQSAGNIEQVDNLTDQIDELNTQLAENTQAIHDNTDAAFDFRTSQINDAATFSQGLFGGAQSFFQALSERTGINTIPQQLAALQGVATSLVTQQQGLLAQLVGLAGLPAGVRSLSGADLVNYLISISSGPIFADIMSRLDPTQQTAFKDLVGALIGNATATEQNTQAITQLTQPGAQSFASTLWSTFRTAVFTGAGGLLPQYQAAVPTAAAGARVLASGMMVVHAGETVRPASVSRNWGGDGGDVYHLNVTTPTQVLNPTDVARQIAFYRKTAKR